MQTFIFISWCLLFDILFAAAGATICTDLKNLQTLLLVWCVTVGGKPFKATSSCNCCRDFYSRTDDDNIVYSLVQVILFLTLNHYSIREQKTINYFYLYLNYSYIFRVFRSLKHTFIEKTLFNTVVYKEKMKWIFTQRINDEL